MLHFTKNDTLRIKDTTKYRKTALVDAKRIMGPFECVTREGILVCEDGYLAIDSEGWPYPIAKEEFENIYIPV